MAIPQRTTGVTNADSTVFAAKASRAPNLLSIQVVNPTGGAILVDIYNGASAGGLLVDTVAVGPYGETWKKWNDDKKRIGRILTAGNAIVAKTRAAVTGGVEVLIEAGRF